MKSDAGDAAQRFTVPNDLLDYFFGVADEQRALGVRCASKSARVTAGHPRSFATEAKARA